MSVELELHAPSNTSADNTAHFADHSIETPHPEVPPQDELVLSARNKVVLQCGLSSITLYANGKIVLRGEYILSAAEGTNRLAGGQIELN